jgi:hypothetical protein
MAWKSMRWRRRRMAERLTAIWAEHPP